MSTFSHIKTEQNNSGGVIKSTSQVKQMEKEVLKNVTIPMYFYNIIVPQLTGYFDLYPVNFDNDPRACCPLHDEDTPSFRYYENTSSFYCFGCGKGGTVINLHIYFAERMNGIKPTREAAVVFLYNYFVKGHETEQFIDQSKQTVDTNEKLNTDIELVKLNIYRVNLEKSIQADNTIKLEVKEQLWSLLDDIDMLISKDLIRADNAEAYIKSEVRRLITPEAMVTKPKIIDVRSKTNE